MSIKTPISSLQEYVVRFNVGSIPKYDLVQVAGPSHDPTFYVKVTVGDQCATGCGRTKKEAKHAAAKAMYDELTRLKPRWSAFSQKQSPASRDDASEPKTTAENYSGSPRFTLEPPSEIADPDREVVSGNPVGELQELCVSRYWPLPVYQMEFEKGLPHQRVFTVSCRVSNIEVIGTGKSKRLGKRAAAFKMLLRIRKQSSMDSNPTWSPNGACKEEFPSPERMARAKNKDVSESQYDGVSESYKVASTNGRRPTAYHSVRGANPQLNPPKGNITVNFNINVLEKSTSAPSGAGAITAQQSRSDRRHPFSTYTSIFDAKHIQISVPSSGDSSRGNVGLSQRAPENARGGSACMQTPGFSRGFIDPNEADYIEGGNNYVTVGELLLELKLKKRRNASLLGGTDSPARTCDFGAPPVFEETLKGFSENSTSSDRSSPTSDRMMTNETCDLKPSERTPQNCEERWMYCLSTTYGGLEVDDRKGGKWMIFAENCYVDEIWAKLKRSVQSGDIWQAKVSWLDPKKKSHAIMVFTLDYQDVDDVVRVLDVLEDTEVKLVTSEIYYGPNYMTTTGVYSGGKQKPWIYRSSDIRERAKTGNYND